MSRPLTTAAIVVLLSFPVQAQDRITEEQIQQVIDATDAASMSRDAEGIGKYLSDSFVRIIEFPHDKWMAKVKLNKDQYLDMIGEGWATTEEYDYRREDTVIYLLPVKLTGKSYSTVTENVMQNGERMTSRFREHAFYALENGRPVITRISGHTLAGDTTPASGQ